MTVTYTKDQRSFAKAHDLRLVTIDAFGMTFQGPVTLEERGEVLAFLSDWLKRRAGRLYAEKEAKK